jgi:hypothetical protein
MSRLTLKQQLARMTREKKIIEFNSEMQENLDEVQHLIKINREMAYKIQHDDNVDIVFTMDGDFIENVLKINIIKYFRVAYAYYLCLMRAYMNMMSKTFTKTQFDATHEKMTEILELKFEVFGMKHHEKWSETAIDNFDVYKDMYKTYKELYNIN